MLGSGNTFQVSPKLSLMPLALGPTFEKHMSGRASAISQPQEKVLDQSKKDGEYRLHVSNSAHTNHPGNVLNSGHDPRDFPEVGQY